ncbi:MAG: preprotein translocase subunit YajC [Clostridia bacterium]|nr:preprotein translocase subunit YajC [Clostridia bacterium]
MGSLLGMLIPILILVAVFYFLMYRPQKKQEKETAAMRDSLKIGDEVCTSGGMLGRIVKIKDEIVTLETGSDKTRIKFYKWAIRSVEISADEVEKQ